MKSFSIRLVKNSLLWGVFSFVWMLTCSVISDDTTIQGELADRALNTALVTIVALHSLFLLGFWARSTTLPVALILMGCLGCVLYYWIPYLIWVAEPVLADDFQPEYMPVVLSAYGWNGLAPLMIAFAPMIYMYITSYITGHKLYREYFIEGKGGSASWAGPVTFVEKLVRIRGSVFSKWGKFCCHVTLGRSLWMDDPAMVLVGDKEDGHVISCACNGAGKSVSTLYLNLLLYRGTAIVVDPVGEQTRQTIRRRSSPEWLEQHGISKGKTRNHMPGGQTYVLDPFNETRLPSWHYNPLSEIDISSDRAREMLSAISDGSITISEGNNNNKYWEEMARYAIEAVTAHVLSRYPKEFQNLPFIYDLLSSINQELKVADTKLFNKLLVDMLMNDACGGLPQQVGARLKEMESRERAIILSEVARSLKWVSDPAMRKHLIKSDFNFADIGTVDGVTQTVYCVLPDGLMQEQMRWLRTLTSVGINLLRNRPTLPHLPTLFILDEFPRLGGQIKAIADGVSTLRKYKVKLWPIIQDISQLKNDYPNRFSSFIANSTKQFYGVNDLETATFISDLLGRRILTKKKSRKWWQKKEIVSETSRELLTPNEVMVMLGKNTNRQIVFPLQGRPMRLERLGYKRVKSYKPIDPLGLWGHYEF